MTKSIRTKIVLPLIAGLLVLGVVGVFTMHRYFAERLTEQTMLRVELLADAIRKSVEINSSDSQHRRLINAFGSTPGVNSIVLVSDDPPRVVASTYNAWNGRLLSELPQEAVGEDLREALSSNRARRHYHSASQEFDFTLPLLVLADNSSASLVGGAVMVHFDARPVRREIVRTTLLWSGLYLLLLLALAVAIYGLLFRWVLKPVACIQRAVQDRAGGDEAARPPALDDDELGHLAGTLNSLMDQISEEKSLSDSINERLKDNESQTRAILNSVRDGIIFADSDGVIHSFNPGAERIFGYPAAQIIGQNLRVLMPETMGRQHDQFVRNYVQTRVAKIIGIGRELEGRRADGSVFPLELAIAEVRLSGRTYFTGIVRDITERKRAEVDLVHARDAALAAARMKSEFVATMSHEIRTPMNGVLGMAQVLGKTSLNADQRMYVDTIVRSGKALLMVLNDILDFSKIEAGRLSLEALDFNLERTVSEVVQLYYHQAINKNLELLVRYAPDCPRFVTGDPGRIRQVLLNLVGNALKFTDKGHVLVEVSLAVRSPDGVQIRFAVTDTGIGLSQGAQSRLFNSFTQADASTTRKYGGTGLGLAICKRLVELMGGEIGVFSSLGQGASFWFAVTMPVATAPSQAPRVPFANARVSGSESAPLATQHNSQEAPGADPTFRGRILLAEDVDFNQLVVKALLEQLGLQVDIANNGQEAIAAFAPDAYDLILMDCQMPVVDGYAATRAIRAKEKPGSHIPIIAVTANVLEADRQKCLEAGMDDFIAKPIEENVVRSKLTTWLRDGATKAGAGEIAFRATAGDVAQARCDLCSEAKFEQLRRLMGAKFQPLVESFIATAQAKLGVLDQAARAGDASTLHSVGHALKGICGNIGASQLQELAGELEKRAQQGQVEGAVGRVAQMVDVLDQTCDWLRGRCAVESAYS